MKNCKRSTCHNEHAGGPSLSDHTSSGPSASRQTFVQELCAELADLPSEICQRINHYSGLSDELVHAAEGIAVLIDDLSSRASTEELQRVQIQMEAYVERAERTLRSLLVFAGEIKGLAWAAGAVEWAQELAGQREC